MSSFFVLPKSAYKQPQFLLIAMMALFCACEIPDANSVYMLPKDMALEATNPDAFSITLEDDANLISSDQGLRDMNTAEDISLDPEAVLNEALQPSQRACLGPWMCDNAQGCHEGVCGSCLGSAECPNGFVCSVARLAEASEETSEEASEETNDNEQSLGRCQACDDEIPNLACSNGYSCIEGRCLENQLQLFSVELSEANWSLVKQERYNFGLEVPCRVRLGHVRHTLPELDESEEAESEETEQSLPYETLSDDLISCKIRVHGGSSRDLRKLSWRLILDEARDEISWGDRHIILRAEYNDLSMMRNVLSYQLFHDWTTLPTPRWRYVWLKVNGRDQGMFVNVERYTDHSMEHWGRDKDSPRYEADPDASADLGTGSSALVPLPDMATYWSSYELKAGASYQPLIDLIENILGSEIRANWNESAMLRLAPQFQWGDHLRYLSIMSFIQNRDQIRKNFLISRQTDQRGTARWEVYPWDLDLSWGCLYTDENLSLCEELRYDLSINMGRVSDGSAPVYPSTGLYNALTERSLTPELAYSRFSDLLCSLTQDLEQNPSMQRIFGWQEALRAYLRPWIALDESRRHEYLEDFDLAVDELNEFWTLRRALIRDELNCP